MKKTFQAIIVLLTFACMAMVGCTDDWDRVAVRPSDVICFTATLGDPVASGTSRSTSGHLAIEEEEWSLEGVATDSRGGLTTALEGNAKVIGLAEEALDFAFRGDELTSAGEPMYWKDRDKSTFTVYAYAPADVTNVADKTISFTVADEVGEQKDVIVATREVVYDADDTKSDFNKSIPLTFNHILTAIRFKLGFEATVKSITVSGVKNQGVYSMTDGTWSSQEGSETYVITSTADGNELLMIPQTLESGAKVTLVCEDGTELEAPLDGQEWKPGKLITYTLHKGDAPDYIYLDLAAGNVTINATTYSGAYYNESSIVEKANESYTTGSVFYVYQSTETTRNESKGIIKNGEFISPGYKPVKRNGGQLWRDYITNNTDVDAVIENWVTDAENAGRNGTKNRIQVNAAANTSYKLIIDDVYSTFQELNQSRINGGIAFSPKGTGFANCTLTVVTVGDNRLGNIHYCTGQNDNGSRIIFEGEGSLTVADVDLKLKGASTGYDEIGYYGNHYCSAIGGNDDNSDNERCRGIVINSGVLFAGSTVNENCSAIGGGGNGIGEVTINGGVVTAVAATTGTAIGGGIGYSSMGGEGIVTINGGNVYAYNLDNERGIPSSAIGGAGSSASTGTKGKVIINGGYVYAYSALGTAIGGGSSRTKVGGDAVIEINGGTVIAKSGKGAGIGGGSACTGKVNSTTNTDTPETYDGGTATVKITNQYGTPVIRTGSIGGGSTGDPDGGKIGSADITIEGGDIQGQFILAAGAKATPKFNLTGGIIRNSNTADTEYLHVKGQGGAVYLEDGNCTISGGTIENCTAETGGAIYIAGTYNNETNEYSASFTMSGGTIKQCTSQGNGGAVCLEGGIVTMSGGTISDCLAYSGNGGGIYIKEGSFYMKDGNATITKNSAILRNGEGGNGGGLYVTSATSNVSVDILSGTITQNTSDRWGGGVCVDMLGTAQAANVKVGTSGTTNPDISRNHTLLSGGGLYVSGANANITINGGKINENTTSAYVANVNVANEGGMVTLNAGDVTHNVVTFHSNNGDDETEIQNIVTATNSLLVAPKFTRVGYTLVGWNTRADGRGDDYADGHLMNISEDLTLYAQWEIQ